MPFHYATLNHLASCTRQISRKIGISHWKSTLCQLFVCIERISILEETKEFHVQPFGLILCQIHIIILCDFLSFESMEEEMNCRKLLTLNDSWSCWVYRSLLMGGRQIEEFFKRAADAYKNFIKPESLDARSHLGAKTQTIVYKRKRGNGLKQNKNPVKGVAIENRKLPK